MTGGDPNRRLRDFIDERWAVIRRNPRFENCPELRVRLDEVTPNEAAWFMESVTRHDGEQPLFKIEDNNKVLSFRDPPNVGGGPRGGTFFVKSYGKCSLLLETIVHQAATWRLHSEFRWPREHLIVESPAVGDTGSPPVLTREALDILALEEPCAEHLSKVSIAAARSQLRVEVGVEVKATKRLLEKLVSGMQSCQGESQGSHSDKDHKKCLAIEVFRPRLFLGVAASETWRLFPIVERDGRAVLGDELRGLDDLHFDQSGPSGGNALESPPRARRRSPAS
jgi:hypothetical protein